MSNELGYLDKIDIIQNRTGMNFGSARNLLEDVDWDVLEALTIYETSQKDIGNQLVSRVKAIISKGNKTKIVVKNNHDTVMELPVTVGILGAVLAPKIALLGAATCLLTRYSLQINKPIQSVPDPRQTD